MTNCERCKNFFENRHSCMLKDLTQEDAASNPLTQYCQSPAYADAAKVVNERNTSIQEELIGYESVPVEPVTPIISEPTDLKEELVDYVPVSQEPTQPVSNKPSYLVEMGK